MKISEKEFDKDISLAIKRYPSLSVNTEKGKKEIRGIIDITDDSNNVIGTFEVSITFGDDYPYRYPKVKELSGIIKKEDDWHCNPDGTLCIAAEPKEIIICRHGINLSWFISEKLIPHIAAQLLRKDYCIDYVSGTYSHGDDGIIEALKEICEENSIEELQKTLKWYLNKPKVGRNDPCFCERNSKFKDCHELKFKELDLLGKAYIEKVINFFKPKDK